MSCAWKRIAGPIKITPDGTDSPITQVQGTAVSITLNDTDNIVKPDDITVGQSWSHKAAVQWLTTRLLTRSPAHLHPGVGWPTSTA